MHLKFLVYFITFLRCDKDVLECSVVLEIHLYAIIAADVLVLSDSSCMLGMNMCPPSFIDGSTVAVIVVFLACYV